MRLNGSPSTQGITLHNDSLRVQILPEEGGKVASFFDVRTNLEFLLQPAQTLRPPRAFDPWDRFENSACSGIDDCLPSVGDCGPETEGGPVPDHGDFWRLPWEVVNSSGAHSLSLAATGYSRPLRIEKQFVLDDSSLRIHYRIRNLGDATVPFLFALHPLFAIDPGDRVVLPAEVSTLRVESSRLERLGSRSALIGWPKPFGAGSALDLSLTETASAAIAEMLYTDRLQSGWCGLYRSQSGLGVVMRFDTQRLPYLGLWLCYGGWPENAMGPLQYAVALEPTVSPRGTLAEALENIQAPVLAARESLEFEIEIERIGPNPVSYGDFVKRCSQSVHL